MTETKIISDLCRNISQGMPILRPEMEEAAILALRSDKCLRGENTTKFEEEFAAKVGAKYAVSTASGTAALQFIILALQLQGKNVVTTPMSFVATANAILQANAKPVFADISYSDYCIDSHAARTQLEAGASALLPVHLFGQPTDFDVLREISEEHDNLPVIEDACQAHGARYKGKSVGSLGVAAAFSFYPSKNMTVLGDGGMVTTNDEVVAKIVAKLRDGGRTSWYEHDMVGFTSRLSSVHSAIGRIQLRHLDEWNRRRVAIAYFYYKNLRNLTEVDLPPMPESGIEPVFHQFVIRSRNRDGLKYYLAGNGIECGIHYPLPIHLQPVYVKTFGYAPGDFPRSEIFSKECLSLPIHPCLSDDDLGFICEKIRSYYDRRRKKGGSRE